MQRIVWKNEEQLQREKKGVLIHEFVSGWNMLATFKHYTWVSWSTHFVDRMKHLNAHISNVHIKNSYHIEMANAKHSVILYSTQLSNAIVDGGPFSFTLNSVYAKQIHITLRDLLAHHKNNYLIRISILKNMHHISIKFVLCQKHYAFTLLLIHDFGSLTFLLAFVKMRNLWKERKMTSSMLEWKVMEKLLESSIRIPNW